MNGIELRSFNHFQIFNWIAYSDLSRNLENWLISKSLYSLQNSESQSNWLNSNVNLIHKCFLDHLTELRSFSHFQVLTKIAYPDLRWNLQVDWFRSLSSFTVKLWKSVKMTKFQCKHDLQVFSSWMEQIKEVLVILKFWPKSHTWTLAKIL